MDGPRKVSIAIEFRPRAAMRTAGQTLASRQLPRDREVHSKALAELGGYVVLGDEPGSLVKLKGVRVPRDRDTADTDGRRKRDNVIDQRRGHSPAHPIGVCEEIDELEEAETGNGGREPGYQVRHNGCDAGSTSRKRAGGRQYTSASG